MFRFFTKLKQNILDWCLSKNDITIGELHAVLNPSPCEIYNEDTLKFIEQTNNNDIMVETPTGYSLIEHTHKTVKYDVWELSTKYNNLSCADDHIIIDEFNNERYVKDLKVGSFIKTKNGVEPVLSVVKTQKIEHMYDIELDDDNHVYYTNNILSHNSITSAAYLLWFSMFHFDKTILIASNKNANAMEMILRIRHAYENLPMWIKPGVKDDGWNKHEIIFDNNSRIISTATSEDSARGMSISLLFLDEFAFVKPNIQDAFWTSVSPTLSTGGSCIMTSTPNGDMNIFAQIWRSANQKTNGFHPIHVKWDAVPGRGNKFKAQEIGKIGERKWNQEYECIFLSSDSLLIDSLYLANITPEIDKVVPIVELHDVVMFEKIKPTATYLIGVDPATGSGNDYSVIEIFHFPSMVQVGEYRVNTMSINDLYTVLKNILKHMVSQNTTVYYSIENNGVGQGLIALQEADEHLVEGPEFVSDEGNDKLGFTTTAKSKMKACVNLKELLERGNMTIKSSVLLSELKSYIRHKGAYAAQAGSTDDCIAACLIIVRLLEEISSYEQDAFDTLYSAEHVDWSNTEWDSNTPDDPDGDYDENDDPPPFVF